MRATAHPGVKKVVVELNRRVGHLEPPDVDAVEEIVWKGRNSATVYDKVVHLVAAETLDGLLEHLRVLNVSTVRNHLHLGLLAGLERAVQQERLVGQKPGQTPRSGRARGTRGGAGADAANCAT